MRYRAGLALLILPCLAACGEKPSPGSSPATAAPPGASSLPARESQDTLAAGQTWRYRTRPEETGSMLAILKIEDQPAVGRVVHIRLSGLSVRRKGDPPGTRRALPDLKFSESAIRASVTERVGTIFAESETAGTATPPQTSGGQVFLVPVNEAVDLIERGLDP